MSRIAIAPVLIPKGVETSLSKSEVSVKGSKGNEYQVDTDKGTCSCPGYTYRGNCKHVKEYCS